VTGSALRSAAPTPGSISARNEGQGVQEVFHVYRKSRHEPHVGRARERRYFKRNSALKRVLDQWGRKIRDVSSDARREKLQKTSAAIETLHENW